MDVKSLGQKCGGRRWQRRALGRSLSASPKEALHLILGREARAPRKCSFLQSRGGAGALYCEPRGPLLSEPPFSWWHLLLSPHFPLHTAGAKDGMCFRRFFSGICLGPASRQPCLASPKPLSSPKHRRDQSSPRLAFAARANSLRHRPTRAGTKLSFRGWLCQMTPRSLSGLENGFPSPSWTSASQQGKIIGAAHVGTRWVPGLGVKGCAESRGSDCQAAAHRF